MFGRPQGRRNFDASARDLASDDPKVRASAAADLARHVEENTSEVRRLLKQALRDEDSRVRSAAALAYADVPDPEATDALIEAIDDAHVDVRQMALLALGERGHIEAHEAVAKALRSEYAPIRFQAVIAYARLCPDREDVLCALLEATRDDDERVCHIALRMAEEIGHGDEPVDPRFIERALVMLDHEAERVRLASAVVLGRCGRLEGADLLCAAAAGAFSTGELEDEAEAIELCAQLELKQATRGLVHRGFRGRLFHRDPLAWQARVALAQLRHPRALQWIDRELRAWNRERRTLAVAAVGRARLHDRRQAVEAMKSDASLADPHAIEQTLRELDETP